MITKTQHTSGYLNFYLGALLLFSYLFFAALADFFLYQSLVGQDRHLIEARLNNYQRILTHAGADKLVEVIEQEQLVDALWLVELKHNRQVQFSNQSLEEADGVKRLVNPQWPILETSGKRWFVQETSLRAGEKAWQLTLGLSSLPRQQQQEGYRWAIVLTLLPLYLISLLLLYWLNYRTLRPIRDLIDTVARIQSGQHLSERVPERAQHTELDRLVQQTNRFLANNERLIQGMKATLDNVAHDLRTPLARQRLRIEQLLLTPSIQAQADLYDNVADLIEDTERIEQMLTTLMDISEAESGLMTLHLTVFEVKPLLEQLLELYEFVAEETQITLSLDCEGGTTLRADQNRLRQVLSNLLDNAIKYSPEKGQVKLWVEVTAQQLWVHVDDSGQGVAEQDLPFIFDRLYRADISRTTKGLGLGLSLVKAVVEAHQGQVQVHNLQPNGCRFSLGLPLSLG
ncbi:Signal transduction histidine kinase [Oceanospirillum multiglobuliferum]|uniref:histidine kinase n=1 Tax=Oceanospirillum multiglobuliferum TaxID=64969 RepID=A0A1T4KC48_9GAMM|nr:HAMP domain-containing sensor histidine kinase [Oceanospirillum multiglobuliferum]OPX55984.1 hypothetical protein BTE48_05310 [Oceanospirillum multiglobuliferum]SJZ40028.1 Signal transduction histidine kinase [Oceanospirillum multiglobuliferum]